MSGNNCTILPLATHVRTLPRQGYRYWLGQHRCAIALDLVLQRGDLLLVGMNPVIIVLVLRTAKGRG